MPRLFGFPWRYGSVPSSPSVVTAETPGRWGAVSGAAKAWGVHAARLMPRFEHVRWGTGRQEWNGGVLGGQMHYVIDSESGFIISENAVAVIASESTLNG